MVKFKNQIKNFFFGFYCTVKLGKLKNFRLILVNFVTHGINAGIILYYIKKKYKPRQTNKEIGIDQDDKANGTAILF